MTRTVSINTSPEDTRSLDQLLQKYPLVSRHAIARAALRAGLENMSKDPKYAMKWLLREKSEKSKT